MRITITLPNNLVEEVHQLLGNRSFNDFARESIALRVAQLKREKVAQEMRRGYNAEAEVSSLDPAWDAIEVEGW